MGSSYRWVVVAAGALMTCVAMGSMFSLAVYLDPMSAATGWSRAGISSALTLDFLVMGIGGFAWGAATDRFGPRPVVLTGALCLGAGLVLASRAGSQLAFQLSYGTLVGLAAGAFFAPMMTAVSTWFEERRGLAVALVSAGMGVAPMTVSPFAGWLITTHDWRTVMATIGIVAWVILIPAALLVRAAPGPQKTSAGEVPKGDVARALTSFPFLILATTFFFCCAAHSGPIFHMMSYAQLCGIPTLTAVSIYSLEGLSGLSGRLVFGISADRLGAKPVLVLGLLIQCGAILGYLLAGSVGSFYLLSVVFGFAYGGVMPLYAVLARQYFGQRIMGTVFGAATMMSSLGMAIGPVMGGLIFDSFHAYRWLYVAAGLLALAAGTAAILLPSYAAGRSWQSPKASRQAASS